jgi:hypothetical protein
MLRETTILRTIGLGWLSLLSAALVTNRVEAAEEEWAPQNPEAQLVLDGPNENPTGTPRVKSRRPRIVGIHLDDDARWSIGMQGYAGLTTLAGAESIKGHALAGGASQVRIRNFQLGGAIEVSDYAGERWRSLGGFVGAFVPFTNWVDIEANLGFAVRSYVSQDTRYGRGGTNARLPELTAYFGITDRLLDGLIGPRMGAGLLLGIDLARRDISWSYRSDGKEISAGSTTFGGTSIGLVMNLGFDVAVRRPQ